MSLIKDVSKQINYVTSELVKTSFSIKENFVSDKNSQITWSNFKDIAFTLKDQPYHELYKQCIIEKAYNFILIDNAIVQLMYRFNKGKLISHRLAYLPHPNDINYQEFPEDFEDLAYGTDYFSEIIEKKVVTIPLRIDFDIDKKKFIEFDHSYAHITFGNYKDCRIPASKPVTPYKFIDFILQSFYFRKYKEVFPNEHFKCSLNFEESITVNEKTKLYFSS